jgi:hypothetical protein
MDQIYLWILILIFIILVLDYSDRYFKKEAFTNKEYSETAINKELHEAAPYYEENTLVVYEPPYTSNALNIGTSKNINFKNFGTNGISPPYIKCPSCELQFDCSNFPYEMDDTYTSVCTKCNEKKFLDENNFPVYAKSLGRPRARRALK